MTTPKTTSAKGAAKKSGAKKSDAKPGGKTVHIWAVEDDWNPEELKSIRSRWNGRLVRASTRISPRLSGHRGSKQKQPANEF